MQIIEQNGDEKSAVTTPNGISWKMKKKKKEC